MNYFGSKKKLLPFLEESIALSLGNKDFSGLTFFDAFSGTANVGKHFKSLGCDVYSCDLMNYAYVLARHYIGNSKPMFFNGLVGSGIGGGLVKDSNENAEKVFKWLHEESFKNQEMGQICKLYCRNGTQHLEMPRNYFTEKNGLRADWLRITIESWKDKKLITEDEYYWLLASYIEAVDDRGNGASTYVAFLKHQKADAVRDIDFKPYPLILSDIEGNSKERVFLGNVNDVVGDIECDILYLDPPYNTRQYAGYYHVLETLALYDNPIVKGKTGTRNYKHQNSDYSSLAKAHKAFEDIIKKAKAKYIFVSYNDDGIMDFEFIKKVLSEKGEYSCYQQKYDKMITSDVNTLNYGKLNTIEYLHCCKI